MFRSLLSSTEFNNVLDTVDFDVIDAVDCDLPDSNPPLSQDPWQGGKDPWIKYGAGGKGMDHRLPHHLLSPTIRPPSTKWRIQAGLAGLVPWFWTT